MSDFTWIPAFKALAGWLEGYEDRQVELIGILRNTGIEVGLEDKDANGNTIPLTEIDPFTFYCMFTKYGIEQRKQFFARLIQLTGLDVDPPTDFDGVPTANAQKAWMFPFKRDREDWMIPALWKLFLESRDELSADTFAKALKVKNTGFAKLTEALFYVAPDRYFPIDGQTRPWLQQMGIPIPASTLPAYLATLEAIRNASDLPFAELSHQAWEKNAVSPFDTHSALGFLDDRFPDTRKQSKYIAAFSTPTGRQIAVTANLKTEVKLYIDARPPGIPLARIEDYPPQRTRNSNLDSNAPQLGVGHQAYCVQLTSMQELIALCDWYEDSQAPIQPASNEPSPDSPMNDKVPLNQILFGPPGTGKTYRTIDKALEILAPDFLRANAQDRSSLKARYDELSAEHRVRFVTFHQSFSYEDFIEGLRADSDGGTLQYRVEPGVFRSICEDAKGSAQVASSIGIREGARIWKISIDGTGEASPTRRHCFLNGEARIGWSDVGDLRNEHLKELPAYEALGSNDRSSLRLFSREIEAGDVLLCIGSEDEIQAIGVVQGEYEYQARTPSGVRPDYVNVLPVRWLTTGLALDVRPINAGRKFTLKTVYEMTRFGWPELAEYMESASISPGSKAGTTIPKAKTQPYVLVIDEINRGNISRIFGELITLIEPSKRKGGDEALEVTLPYSKKKFSVPDNVYLIGTMNTSDRSLAGLDIALRRRFVFEEILPAPELLADRWIGEINLEHVLRAMNERIEVLLGRDYLIGHAYFMSVGTLADLENVFRRQIIPLLQEYFFEDWENIALVLNDPRKPAEHRFLKQPATDLQRLFGREQVRTSNPRWELQVAAFGNPASYSGICPAG